MTCRTGRLHPPEFRQPGTGHPERQRPVGAEAAEPVDATARWPLTATTGAVVPELAAVIFDLDGVLTDTAEYHYRGWRRLADELGIPFTREENEALRGIPRRESLLALLKGRPATEEQLQAWMACKNNYYLEFIREISPRDVLPGARELLEEIRARGVEIHFVTLHVGLGTFAPVKAEVLAHHQMHEERYELSAATADAINAAKRSGRRVVAVGTTTVRVLESVAQSNEGSLVPGPGRTRIFIHPPFKFQIADALLTNFHLPRSTLLMLVSAFAAPLGLADPLVPGAQLFSGFSGNAVMSIIAVMIIGAGLDKTGMILEPRLSIRTREGAKPMVETGCA